MTGIIFIAILLFATLIIWLGIYFLCSYAQVYCTEDNGNRKFIGILWKSKNTYSLYEGLPYFSNKIGYVDQQNTIHIDSENDQHNYVKVPYGSINDNGEVFDISNNLIAKCEFPEKRLSSVIDASKNNIEVAFVQSGFKKVHDVMVRAAGFGALWHEAVEHVDESKSDVRIGFKDLALPSTIIFLLLFIPFGIIANYYSWFGFLGDELSYISWMLSGYGLICLSLFLIKSHFTIRNKSLSFFTGLIDRNVGVAGWNILIIVSAVIGMVTSVFITNYTIFPAFLSIFIGFVVNLNCYKGDWSIVDPVSTWGKKWRGKGVPQNSSTQGQTGFIDVEFDWAPILASKGIKQIDADRDKVIVSIKEDDLNNLQGSRVRQKNPFKNGNPPPFEELKKYASDVLGGSDESGNTYEKNALEQIILSAYQICKKYNLADFELYDLILMFCQDESIIKYVTDDNSEKIGKIAEYFRFPIETLYDKEGDCDCKSVLAYKIFQLLNVEPRFAIVKSGGSDSYNHAAVVLRKKCQAMVQVPTTYKAYDDLNQYVFCEATSGGYHPGDIPSDVDVKSIVLV